MQTTTAQLQNAFEKARRVSVELMLSGREHDVPEIRAAINHLLDHPQNMDAGGPAAYLAHSVALVQRMERQAAHALPQIVPFIRELHDALAHDDD